MTNKNWKPSANLLVGIILFLVAFGLRMLGLKWGLPNSERFFSLHPDESVVWIYSQQLNWSQGKFEPGFFNYGTLYLTLLNWTNEIQNLFGLAGKGLNPNDPNSIYLLIGDYNYGGRFINVLFGSGLAVAIFASVKRFLPLFPALMAGLAIAFAPGLVVHSRFQTVDMLAVFLLGIAFYFLAKVCEEPETFKPWLFLGVFAGLSAGTKYTGILAILCLLPILYSSRGNRVVLLNFAKCFGISLLSFVFATPGVLLNTSKFLQDFRYEQNHMKEGHGLVFAATTPGPVYHFANLIVGFGLLVTLFGFGGLVLSQLKQKSKLPIVEGESEPDEPEANSKLLIKENYNLSGPAKHWFAGLIIFCLVYFVIIARAEVKFLRYVFPMIPVLAAGFAVVIYRLETRKSGMGFVFGIIAIMGVMTGGGLTDSLVYTRHMLVKDSRDQAGEYLKSATSVGFVSSPWFAQPTLFPMEAAPRSVPIANREQFRRAAKPTILMGRDFKDKPEVDFDLDLFELKPEYIAISSFESNDLDRISESASGREKYAGQAENYAKFMDRLAKEYGQHKVFGDPTITTHDLMYIRPAITLWKRKSDLK